MVRKSRPMRRKLPAKKGKVRPVALEGTPADRLRELLESAKKRGVRPMDEATLDAMGEVWPPDEDLDEFLSWLRKSRREGRY